MPLQMSAKEAAKYTGKLKQPTKRAQDARSIEKPAEGDIPNTRIENATHRVKRGLPFENAPHLGSRGIITDRSFDMVWFQVARSDGGSDALFGLRVAEVDRYMEEVTN